MTATYFKSGSWNAICDICGRKYKAEQLKKRWDGYMVCKEDWETRHPQDLIRPIKEFHKLPWTRPRTTDEFLPELCTPMGLNGVAGVGSAGCAIVGYDNGQRGLGPSNPPTFNPNTL